MQADTLNRAPAAG